MSGLIALQLARLDPVLLGALGLVFGLLVLAEVALASFALADPCKDRTEVRDRIRSWWGMVLLFGAAMLVSPGTAVGFFALVSYLALKEYLSAIPTRRVDRKVLLWAYLTIPLQYLWVYQGWYGMAVVFIPVYAFVLLPTRMLMTGSTRGMLGAMGTLHWGLMTTVFSLSHAAFLLTLRLPGQPASLGPRLVLFLVALTQLNDVAQYLWGKSAGHRKIVPTVSPGKTWAGFAGGCLTTVALACALGPLVTPLGPLQSLAAGLILSVGGFLGDVSLSAVKRDLGLKDLGSTLPGHGGVLDRVDSLTYTAPLFFHWVYYLLG